jgi:hypothetical protein
MIPELLTSEFVVAYIPVQYEPLITPVSLVKPYFSTVRRCTHTVTVRYHEDGSKKLNACIQFFLDMVYF